MDNQRNLDDMKPLSIIRILLQTYLLITTGSCRAVMTNDNSNNTVEGNIKSDSSVREQLTTTTLYYAYPVYDLYSDMFTRVGSEYCDSKIKCNNDSHVPEIFPTKNCYCDSICVLAQDCCPGYRPANADIPKLSTSVLECIRFEDAISYPGYGVTMVTKCEEKWTDMETKKHCESVADINDTLLNLPVSDPSHNILFKNMYCALCNFYYDFNYWKIQVYCKNDTERYVCLTELQNPDPENRVRKCPLQRIEDTCNASRDNFSTSDIESCIKGNYSLVYVQETLFKNKQCAFCNGYTEEEMFCESTVSITPLPTISPRRGYTFRMLVDFNSRNFPVSCKDNEIFDPMGERCREIMCPSPLSPRKGRCVRSNSGLDSRVNSSLENCTLTKLDPTEYEFINGSRVFVFSSQKVYKEDMFNISGGDVFICLEMNQTCIDCNNAGAMFQFDKVESYLSLVSLIISLIALSITFFVYTYFNELLNIPGKILLCLIISLFIAQLLFLISPESESSSGLCIAVSVMMHYFFLAAFCWMNVIALDLWMTFSNQFISPGSGSKSFKRFLMFSMYGWVVPLVIVASALIVENTNFDSDFNTLKPHYGQGVCWITSRDGLILFFAGPLAIFKLFDIVAFVFTSVHIFRAKRQGAMARQKTDVCSFFINLKLSLVMGLTWVFAFIANAANVRALWYMFIVCNCLQGLFIGVSFLCTNKVRRLVRVKYEEVSKSKNSTQLTSLTPSSELK